MMSLTNLQPIKHFYKRLAPWLLECDFPKKVCTLQLFTNPEQGEIFHLLFVGEAASGKSDLLAYQTGICPNSSYVGLRTTPVGLIEDLIHCDKGIIGVEEFDKLPLALRNHLLEMMESQQVKITMHNVSRTIPTRTNILAVCNPRNNVLDEFQSAHQQLSFSGNIPLLTRFALILPFKALGKEKYGDVAVSGNYDREEAEDDKLELKKYLIYIRRILPKIIVPDQMAREAGEFIAEVKGYSRMTDILSIRTVKNGFLSALKAQARMNLRNIPDQSDFDEIKQIFETVHEPT